MYSDTHFHFEHLSHHSEIDLAQVLTTMAKRKTRFGLEIGTEAHDLEVRQACVDKAIAQMPDTNLADRVRSFMYFSAGIWPGVEDIINRHERMEILKDQINKTNTSKDNDTLHRKIIAIGECGLDHHWNPSGVDGRCESSFNDEVYKGESELFKMQLKLSRDLDLPIIIHSRDAFEGTLQCIKEMNYDRGIIHCCTYGLEEVKAFVERGWYISFSGSVTYTKKSKMEAMKELLRYVPDDKLLLETDSPFLAPTPHRGQINTPVFIEETYKFISEIRGMKTEDLSDLVDNNVRNLFKVNI